MRTKTLEQKSAQDLAGLQVDQLQKLRNGNMTFEQIFWFNNLSYEQRQALMDKQTEQDFLKDLGTYSIPGYSETKNLGDREKDFKSFFDADYKKWKLAQSQQVLGAGSLNIKEMKPGKDGNYSKIFNAFGRLLDEMAITENRINQILFSDDAESKKIREVLDLRNFWTHFLIKKDNEFFVVYVRLYSAGLDLSVNRFDDARVWCGDSRDRFVVAV